MESTDSSTALQHRPQLPPGFRFHPTDEELVVHYLNKKVASAPLPVSIIAEVNLYKFDPWELPAKATFGEQEWYFFTPRDRKYPNGARPNRAATSGYWKATGTDKPIMASGGTQKVGVKKALVFYGGKPPRGIKTNWIMHEYRLAEDKTNSKPPVCNKKGSSRLDDWVLCRIYKRNNSQRPADHDRCDSLNDMLGPIGPSTINSIHVGIGQQNPKLPPLKTSNYGTLLEDEHNVNMFEGMVSSNTTDGGSMSQLVQSGSSKPQLPMFSATAPPHLPVKLPLPTPYSWNDRENTEAGGCSLTTKIFLADGDDGSVARTDENNGPSIATLLSHFPQTPPLHQQTMLGSLGDGAFRQPYQFSGLNWYS